ncbi:FAD-dependent oxidoreductase [Desulfovibrio sp. OttesenSCG-928-C06]|nr:FAD-dependent oxidoreductase [Desulfovibrio sp. OttesenSCG-928-C06]
MKEDIREYSADVLVVGGGIAGLMAAIAAAEEGASVILAEKANTKRSGSGATGNDHFLCYIPEKHGADMQPILREVLDSMVGLCHDKDNTRRFLQESFEVVQLWNEWGIAMRPHGDWEFMGHAFPGRPRVWLKYDGHNQKPALTAKAKSCGVEILNHLPVVDLCSDESGICGALAMDVRGDDPEFVFLRAKTVVLATGSANRMYSPAGTPGWMFNTAFCPSCTGAAQAQAWRIGANLVNMELPNRHAGPKYFSRAGKSTWIGVYRYPDGRPLGPFVTEATKEYGDITCDVWNSAFTDLMLDGRGPAYLDCSGTSPEDLEYMRWGMRGEGLTALLDYLDEKKIDPGKRAVEFMQYEPHLIGRGLEIDIDGQTSLPGLFAAGDMVGNFRGDIGGAAVYGRIAGRQAARLAGGRSMPTSGAAAEWRKNRSEYYLSYLGQGSHDAGWREANLALHQICNDYIAAGPHRVRSATLLKAGMEYLEQLRANIRQEVRVANSHELLRLIEVLDLMDCAEVIFHSAGERKETRGMHIRSDFSFTNPLLSDKFLLVCKSPQNSEVSFKWRSIRN